MKAKAFSIFLRVRHGHQTDAAELEHVAEQKAYAKHHDAELEEEFVSGDAGLEDFWHAHDVGDDKTDHDRPQHVFYIRQCDMVGVAVDRDRVLDQLAGITDDQQQSDAGHQLDETLGQGNPRSCGDGGGHRCLTTKYAAARRGRSAQPARRRSLRPSYRGRTAPGGAAGHW
jgi:hypothetical protein